MRYVSRAKPKHPAVTCDDDDLLFFEPMTMDVLEEDWDFEPTGLLDAVDRLAILTPLEG